MEGGEDVKLQSFLEWAASIGVSDSPSSSSDACPSRRSTCLGQSLLVSQFPDAGGRGFAAARELTRGELILRVPRAALMMRESLLNDEKLTIYVKKYTHLSSTQILSVLLLAEVGKGRDSWWTPYLMQLPRTYDTLSSFNKFEIQALQVDDAIWAAEKAVSKAWSHWNEAVSLMKDIGLKPQLATFRSWLWAFSTISSRTLHVPWDDAGCLCPVGDFFNYSAPEVSSLHSEETKADYSSRQATSLTEDEENLEKSLGLVKLDESSLRLTDGGYEEHAAAYCFYARKNYQMGEQVLICYGTYTNLELLEHYGFVLNTNINDKAFIELDPGVMAFSSWPPDTLYIQQDGKPSFALLSALRLWAAPANLQKSLGYLVYSGSMLSAESEMFVMNWLANKCRDVLEKLPTTMEDDRLLILTIEEMQNQKTQQSCGKKVAYDAEISKFFETMGMNGCGGGYSSQLSNKVLRSMGRWKLATKWRFMYKKILSDCISYCNEMIISLKLSNVCAL